MSLTLETRRLAHAAKREMRGLGGGVPILARLLLAASRLLPNFTLASVRAWLYRKAGFPIEKGVALLGKIILVGEGDLIERLSIGKGSIVAPGVTFCLDATVSLGRNVSIGPGAVLYTATHAIGFGSRRMTPTVSARPITVEDGAWIGMHSLILPGVIIGHGAVVAAGAVVMENVPPNTLAMGNPATVRQSLPFGDR